MRTVVAALAFALALLAITPLHADDPFPRFLAGHHLPQELVDRCGADFRCLLTKAQPLVFERVAEVLGQPESYCGTPGHKELPESLCESTERGFASNVYNMAVWFPDATLDRCAVSSASQSRPYFAMMNCLTHEPRL